MQVSLSNGERHIDLQQGEAFFEVAKDPGGRSWSAPADGKWWPWAPASRFAGMARICGWW